MKHLVVFLVLCAPAHALANPHVDQTPTLVEPSAGLRVKGALTADFSYASEAGQETNAFEVRRVELGIERRGDHELGGEILIESLRSAGPDSFSGIDGDSLLMRVKRAWGFARETIGEVEIEGRFGLVASPWLEAAEADSELRYLEPLTAERLGIYLVSDLGAVGSVTALSGRVKVQAGVFNGEGRNQVEQNNGKNSQVLVSGTVLKRFIAAAPFRLRLYAGGQEGSLGPSAAASHRLSLGASGLHRQLSAGAEVHFAKGVADVSSRESRALGLWMRARWRNFSLVVRYDHHRQDLDRSETSSQLLIGGLFAERMVESTRVRLGLATRYEKTDENASPIPGLASSGTVKAALVVFSARFGAP